MRQLIELVRRYRQRKLVRPWALLVPTLILLICAPVLRPILHPEPSQISDDELARLATIESFSERKDLAIDHSEFKPLTTKVRVNDRWYAQQPPVLSVLLAGPYTLMRHFGLSFASNPTLAVYLLTMIGSTLPVALGAGLIYRAGRMFELLRYKRAILAFACAFGTGWISYATVINPYAPAGALVIGAVACIVHFTLSPRPQRAVLWMFVSGLCASLAGVIELGCFILAPLLLAAIFMLRQKKRLRLMGGMLFLLGCAIPLGVHVSLTQPTYGDWRVVLMSVHPQSMQETLPTDPEDEPVEHNEITLAHRVGHLLEMLFSSHGLLVHFPILLLGAVGISMVMHRHWPGSTKMLASASAAFALGVMLLYAWLAADWHGGMFAARVFVVFSPLLLYWAGVWMRRAHRPVTWSIVGVVLLFSVIISILGMRHPTRQSGYAGKAPATQVSLDFN